MSDLREAIRTVYADLLRERERWAKSILPAATQRAVAYQSAASMVLRALDENPETATYLHPPHDGLAQASRSSLLTLGGRMTETSNTPVGRLAAFTAQGADIRKPPECEHILADRIGGER